MRFIEKLRKPDWLAELQAAVVLGLVLLVLVGGWELVGQLRAGPVELTAPAGEVTGRVEYGLRDGVEVVAGQDLRVAVAEPTVEQRVAFVLTQVPTYAVAVVMLVLLLRMVRLARRRDPFSLGTVRRLRVLAVVALAGGYGATLLEFFAAFHLSSTVLAEGLTAPLWLQEFWLWFLLGFGLFAVAEVVKRGGAMRAELETVV